MAVAALALAAGAAEGVAVAVEVELEVVIVVVLVVVAAAAAAAVVISRRRSLSLSLSTRSLSSCSRRHRRSRCVRSGTSNSSSSEPCYRNRSPVRLLPARRPVVNLVGPGPWLSSVGVVCLRVPSVLFFVLGLGVVGFAELGCLRVLGLGPEGLPAPRIKVSCCRYCSNHI